jgi:hypothetical protein
MEPRMHTPVAYCREVGVRKYDTSNNDPDAEAPLEPRYGMISAAFNEGLRNPESKKGTVDAYNSGCINPQGCVNIDKSCAGPLSKLSPGVSALYDSMQKTHVSPSFEFSPPEYVMGVKHNSINSVTGWSVRPDGKRTWQAGADCKVPR